MKSNLIISGCVLALVALAVALVVLTISPVVSTVAHTKTSSYDYYFKPNENGKQPTIADNVSFLDKYNVICMGSADSKVIYLTFDMGYENGYTEKILDILKEKKVPAAFFITGHYISTHPELIKRMHDEGHLVCNHTMNHKDLSAITSPEAFAKEVDGLNEKYKAIIGEDMPKYLRPPAGVYSEQSIQMANELGYTVVFWSFAYRDWLNDKQPDPAKSIEKIISQSHPGAVVLLHANSSTNAEILGTVIDQWKKAGYTLKSLDDFPKEAKPSPSPSPSPSAAQHTT